MNYCKIVALILKATWLLVLPTVLGRGEAKYLVQGSGIYTLQQPKVLEGSVTDTTNTAAVDKFTWQELLALKHSIYHAYCNGGTFRLVFNYNTLKIISK